MNNKKKVIYFFYLILAKNLPSSYSRINFGSKAIRGWFGSRILNNAGKNINIEKGAIFSDQVDLGDNSGLGINSKLYGRVIIGCNVMMGPDCLVYTRNHNIEDVSVPMNVQGETQEMPVVIENDVWIGARVIILPGKRIGKGSVVGAGAVVSRDIPEFSVAVGNPIRIIRNRKIDM